MSSSPRVNFVHQSFGDYTSGLVSALKQTVSLHVTSVVSGTPNPGLSDHASEVLRCRRFRDPRSPVSAMRAVKEIARQDYDVLHWQAAGNPWVDLAALRIVGARPFVLTIHDMQAHPGDQAVLPGTFGAIRRLARRADQIIVHAESVRHQVLDFASSAPVHVVPHGELGSVYRQPNAASFAFIGQPQSSEKVLFFGRVCEYKGLAVLLEAMKLVVARSVNVRLVVAGRGPALASALANAGSPAWLDVRNGYVDRSDVALLFRDCDVVALPYLEASQSGVAALAVGLGKATVASAVGGLAELIEHERCGLLVPPDDPDALARSLLRVLTDLALKRRLEEGARTASTSRLAWPTIAQQTTEIYRQAATYWRQS